MTENTRPETFDEIAARITQDVRRLQELHHGEKPTPLEIPERPSPPKDDLPTVRVTVGEHIHETGSDELTRFADNGVVGRIYRMRAGGVTRVVVSLVGGKEGSWLLEDLEVWVGDSLVYAHPGEWVLDPGQAWHAIYYVTETGYVASPASGGRTTFLDAATRFWRAFAADHFRPVPAWAPRNLKSKAMELLSQPQIGPFQPGLRGDKSGSGPGADFGVAVAAEESWLCPEGFALWEIHGMQVTQRDRSFWVDGQGEPEWAPYNDYWQTWQHRAWKVSKQQETDARAWWINYPKMRVLRDFDDQHAGRAFRMLLPLAEAGDPWAKWCVEHRANRMRHQWGTDQDSPESALLRGIEAVRRRIKVGEGSPSFGRAFVWAWRLALATNKPLSDRMAEAVTAAYNPRTGEIHADPSPDYIAWARDEWPGLPASMTHEMAMSVWIRRLAGGGMGEGKLAALLAKDAHKGKAKVFGADKWLGPALDYVPATGGNLDEFGGFAGLLEIAAKRDPLDSGNPLLSVPRRWYESALLQEARRG